MTSLAKGQEAIDKIKSTVWSGCCWDFEGDLKYVVKAMNGSDVNCCNSKCSKSLKKESTMKCSACSSPFCNRECLVQAWKLGHNDSCQVLKRMRSKELTSIDKQSVVKKQLRRIRMFMCPYIVAKGSVIGPGFSFISTTHSFTNWITYQKISGFGEILDRGFKLEFMTIDELDSLISDNFELGVIRPSISKLVSDCDHQKEFVFALLFSCGLFVTAKFPLVPDHALCLKLGTMYEFDKLDEPLLLNIDNED